MVSRKETFIGKVRSVTGSKISIQLDDRVYRSAMPVISGILYRIGQIGSFVKMPLGFTHLYGVVTQAGADAIPESLREGYIKDDGQFIVGNKWITVVLVGERMGSRFERGVAQYPATEDEVHLVTIEDLQVIYSGVSPESSITVGQISASESLPAKLDLNRLVTRHCAIVGSTGSGKSNSVSVILNAIASGKQFGSHRVLIIDPHGEYNESLGSHCKVFKINASTDESELYIPYWALPFKEFVDIFSGKLSDAQRDYLRMEIFQRKVASSKFLKQTPNESSLTSDSPIPFSLSKLWFDLDDFERQTYSDNTRTTPVALLQKGDHLRFMSNRYPAPAAGNVAPYLNMKAHGILAFLESVRNRALDDRYKFLFKCGAYQPNDVGQVEQDLDVLLGDWLGHDRPVTILDLSGIPSEIMVSVSGTLLKIIYDCLYWGQSLPVGGRNQPLLIALEEAHNYLRAGDDSIASRTVQAIAKEGRKYGVGLMLITQRPSELDETVLSQCGSIIALRMTNGKDRSHVSSAIQDDLQDLVGLLPSLRTGEGLVMGEVVRIPSRIKFDRAVNAAKSSDPVVSKLWRKPRPEIGNYREVIDFWRSGRLKK